MMSMGMPASSITFSAPICATPLAPPPLSTTATFLRLDCGLYCAQTCVTAVRLANNTIQTVFLIDFVFLILYYFQALCKWGASSAEPGRLGGGEMRREGVEDALVIGVEP